MTPLLRLDAIRLLKENDLGRAEVYAAFAWRAQSGEAGEASSGIFHMKAGDSLEVRQILLRPMNSGPITWTLRIMESDRRQRFAAAAIGNALASKKVASLAAKYVAGSTLPFLKPAAKISQAILRYLGKDDELLTVSGVLTSETQRGDAEVVQKDAWASVLLAVA